MTQTPTPIILYVGFAQPDEWQHWAGTYARHAEKFERACEGALCVVVPFYRFTEALVERIGPQSVVLSGFARSFEQYEVESFTAVTRWLEKGSLPTLALCGSHQLLGYFFNGEMENAERLYDKPMRPRRPDEPVTNPDYHPDFIMERGFYPLELTPEGERDALFSGLSTPPLLYESHYCELKQLPEQFTLLASTTECRIQAMKRRDFPMYGLQFHPEDASERFPDGQRLLENFFRWADEWTAAKGPSTVSGSRPDM